MMEAINGGSQYMKLVHSGVHMNLNSALYGLVTPPRRAGNRTPPQHHFQAALSRSVPTKGSMPPRQQQRDSPSRLSPCSAQGGFYAGAKFGERPPPTELPKPPNHWVQGGGEEACLQMTHSLKVLLKVQ